MERGLDTPEHSQGDAGEAVESVAPNPGETEANVGSSTEADPETPPAAVAAGTAAAASSAQAAVIAEVTVAAAAGDEPVPASGRRRKRTVTGSVVSDKGDRTIVVSIARRKKHRLYKKYITLTKKLKAHDPDDECRVGDLVRVVESRPLSREKRWRLVEIVKRAG